jgi:RHS repeat-associated protein
MKKIIYLLLVLFPVMAIGQTATENYIKTTSYKVPSKTAIPNPTISQAAQSVTYFDGLGRPVQQIANQQSATGKDIITHIKYDSFGRQIEEYLPFKASTNNMAFDPAAETNTLSYYGTPNPLVNGNPLLEATSNPFSRKELEASPLNRILKQAAPGNDWKSGLGHEIKIDYQTNVAGEVKLFTANTLWDPLQGLYTISLSNQGSYAANELYKTVTYDENTAISPVETDGATIEFKNKEGQLVLKRTYGTVAAGTVNEKHDTYYVYDDYGNLTYVIPPKATDLINAITTVQADVISTVKLLPSDLPLHLTASNSIRLLNGFRAQTGSTFSAVIDQNQGILDNLCYQYKYDHRNRVVEKKLPGKQWEFIVYDKLDRVVATGPALSPFTDLTTTGWLITKYDVFNRPVYTGWMTSTAATTVGRTALQTAQNNPTTTLLSESKQTSGTIDGIATYYSNTVVPTAFKLLSVSYYDNYTFPSTPVITIPATVESQTCLTTNQVKGLTTASWLRVPTTSTATLGETSATFYDAKARPIRQYMTNFLGGNTSTDSSLDPFSGQLKYSITKHQRLTTDAVLTTKDAFTYSAQDRLLKQTHQINTGTVETIGDNTYDELGQLIAKKVGNGVQNINYTYNIRGWLTGINDITSLAKSGDPKDLFAFKINYNTTVAAISGVKLLYNGNIAETQWATNSDNGMLRTYGYKYDNLNRLREGVYKKATTISNAYNESLQYDKNGNITKLKRYGSTNDSAQILIDDLTYLHKDSDKSNQLMKVTDLIANNASFLNEFKDSASNTADDYSYDANGNMTSDNNKNITAIAYNHLNLPTKITFGTTGNIVYLYNAAGQKVQKTVTEIGKPLTATEYLGGYQYEKIENPENTVVTLKFFPTAEGYVEPAGSSYKYVYQYKDHLGNIRLSYRNNGTTASPTLQIAEESNYYPFGLKHAGYNTAKVGVENKYKYQGQERQDELSLNWDSFKYRNYDYAIGRFMCIDPLAEKYSYQSPYNFAENKVISHRELEGLEGVWFQAVMNADKAANPNGVSAHVMGISQGLVNSAKGLINAVAHPVETAKGIANMAVAGAVGNNPVSMLRVDNAIGTNSFGTSTAVSKSIDKGVSNLVSGNGQQRGEVIGEIAGAVIGAKGMGAATKALSTAGKTTSLFRAVSTAELTDIASNGLRTTSGGYETSKLFATSAQDAAQFGKLNYGFDGIPNTIIEAKVPTSVMGTVTNFTADGMSAVAVPAEQLQNIKKVIPSNSSPIGN